MFLFPFSNNARGITMLTNQQNIALSKIKDFLNEKNAPIFILKGYAGTGKTTLVKYLCEMLKEDERKFMLTAPTGRAARILSKKTGEQARTIHSAIYAPDLSFQDDQEEGENERIQFPLKYEEFENTLMIVDEASMISDKTEDESYLLFGSGSLMSDIFTYMRIDENNNNKIIFVGDPAQLPPVNDNFSPALDKDYISDKYMLECRDETLTEIVRQSRESLIPEYSLKIRSSLEKELFNSFDLAEGKDVKHNHFFDDLRFSEIDEDRIVVSFTNKRSLYYNKRIRKDILHISTDEVVKGDRLLVVQNNRKYKLFNGDFIEVTEIYPGSKELHSIKLRGKEEFIFEFIRAKISFLNELNQSLEIEAKLLLNHIYSDKKGLSLKEQIALRILAEREENFSRPFKKLFKNNPSAYNTALEKYLEKLSASEYFNAVQVKFGYAVTCHKAQGGEWKDVIVDFNDFKSYTNEFFYRWSYTAITRASEKLFLINSPEITPLGVSFSKEYNQTTDSVEINNMSSEEIEIPSNLITDQSKAIYRALFDNHLFAVDSVTPMNYRDRYKFLYNKGILTFDFIYNKKGNVNYSFVGKGEPAKEIIDELDRTISKISIKDNEYIDERELLILQAIERQIELNGITINSIRSRPYLFLMECSKEAENVSLKIYYNKKYIISKVEADYNKSSSNIFADFCKSLIKIGN